MNKTILVLTLFILIASSVSATRVGSPDVECREQGFDYGIAKFEYEQYNRPPVFEIAVAPSGQYVLSEEGILAGYTIDVTGDNYLAYWTANPNVDGVISKQGQNTYNYTGGLSGQVTPQGQQSISHITFCGNENDVPEFGVIAALSALGLAGLFIYKKRN